MIFTTKSHSSSSISITFVGLSTPALLTKISIRPNSSKVELTVLSISIFEITLPFTNIAFESYVELIWLAVWIPEFSLRSFITILQDSDAKFNATALPIPWPAPVIIATFLDWLFINGFPLLNYW